MNESIDIYTQFGIDKSKLKRDYIQNPLYKGSGGCDKGEKPFKEDFQKNIFQDVVAH